MSDIAARSQRLSRTCLRAISRSPIYRVVKWLGWDSLSAFLDREVDNPLPGRTTLWIAKAGGQVIAVDVCAVAGATSPSIG